MNIKQIYYINENVNNSYDSIQKFHNTFINNLSDDCKNIYIQKFGSTKVLMECIKSVIVAKFNIKIDDFHNIITEITKKLSFIYNYRNINYLWIKDFIEHVGLYLQSMNKQDLQFKTYKRGGKIEIAWLYTLILYCLQMLNIGVNEKFYENEMTNFKQVLDSFIIVWKNIDDKYSIKGLTIDNFIEKFTAKHTQFVENSFNTLTSLLNFYDNKSEQYHFISTLSIKFKEKLNIKKLLLLEFENKTNSLQMYLPSSNDLPCSFSSNSNKSSNNNGNNIIGYQINKRKSIKISTSDTNIKEITDNNDDNSNKYMRV